MAKKNKQSETAETNEGTESGEATLAAKAKKEPLRHIRVPVKEVWADWKRNPRAQGARPSKGDLRAFCKLQESIRTMGGIMQAPVAIEEAGPNGEKYRIIAGYRRFEAMLDLSKDDKERFGEIPLGILESTDVEFGATVNGEPDEGGIVPQTFERTTKTGLLGELLLSATENAVRQDVSVWDRIALTGKMQREGLENSEIVHVLGEQGYDLGVNTVANYGKIASLPAPVKKRLQPLGGVGFSHAMAVIKKEFRVGGVPNAPWDAAKQLATIDSLTAQKEEKKKKKASGVKPERYVLKPSELAERLEDIAAVCSGDVKATLEYLLGKITRTELVAETDEEFAAALTGEGADPKEGAAEASE